VEAEAGQEEVQKGPECPKACVVCIHAVLKRDAAPVRAGEPGPRRDGGTVRPGQDVGRRLELGQSGLREKGG